MKPYVYEGGLKLVKRSGVGKAIGHQEAALGTVGIVQAEHWREADIVHINTVFPDAVAAALLAHLQGKKVICYGHSTKEDFRNSFPESNRLAPLFERWIRFCYSKGDVIITPTEYSKGLLEGYGIKKPIFAVSNGIDLCKFSKSEAAGTLFRQKYNLKPKQKVVISVGHYIERKGILDFLWLAEQLPEVTFLWFGYTDRHLVPRNVREAMEKAPGNVHFPGFVSEEELRGAYSGADAFAFLSQEETEGIVVLEALACKCPVLLRAIPVYDGWLTDGENVYKAADRAAFLEKLQGILSGSLPDTTEKGWEVSRNRSLRCVGEQLREIYDSCYNVDRHCNSAKRIKSAGG